MPRQSLMQPRAEREYLSCLRSSLEVQGGEGSVLIIDGKLGVSGTFRPH